MEWVKKNFYCRNCGKAWEESVTPGTVGVDCLCCRYMAELQEPDTREEEEESSD